MSTSNDIAELLRARFGVLWLTSEETRRTAAIIEAARKEAGFDAGLLWTPAERTEFDRWARKLPTAAADPKAKRLHVVFSPPLDDPAYLWAIRSAAMRLRESQSSETLIVVHPTGLPPPGMREAVRTVQVGRPGRDELAAILSSAGAALPEATRPDAATRHAILDAASGLLAEEFADALARSIVASQRLDPAAVGREKRRLVAASGVLEWWEPREGGFDTIGGHGALRDWARLHKSAVSRDARAHGIPFPRGIGLTGPAGVGKSASAAALAAEWGIPLLRFDPGRLFAAYIGESEERMREVIATAEAAAPCVLFIDEVEKAFAGATGGSHADGGLVSRLFGTFLSWLQDRRESVAVVWTANQTAAIPPEFMRPGRFDAVFELGMPDEAARREIARIHIGLKRTPEDPGRDPAAFDLATIAAATDGLTGAAIEAAVVDGMLAAYAAREAFETRHVLGAVPPSRTNA